MGEAAAGGVLCGWVGGCVCGCTRRLMIMSLMRKQRVGAEEKAEGAKRW